ncbi:MAG TPA: class A beta-lactamase [Victivallales bacterium]|nr:class A beta-lactamase [Victivallales bacterium]
MNLLSKKTKLTLMSVITAFTLFPLTVFGHCNSDKGPVVQASLLALKTGDVNTILIWMPPACTNKAINLFEKTVKMLETAAPMDNTQIKTNFYTAMVKCHLKGEGMTFTGVKHIKALPSIIQLSDGALENGKPVNLLKITNVKPLSSVSIQSEADFLTNQVSKTLYRKYNHVLESYKAYNDMKTKLNTKAYNEKLVNLGREYVKNYVNYTHYVLNIYILAHDKLPIDETYYSKLGSILSTIKEQKSIKINQNSTFEKFKNIESRYGVKLGVAAINSANNEKVQYNADDRFPFCSTGKVFVVSSVLFKSMSNPDILKKKIKISSQVVEKSGYAPITKKYIGKNMSVTDLCKAAIEYSDNAATNLLVKYIVDRDGVNEYAKFIGDNTFRLDRSEPSLNSATPGDIRDTTTPDAMAKSLNKLILGNLFEGRQKELLISWLKGNTTGDKKIRAGVPKGWIVGDKTGGGSYGVNNDIGVVWPPDGKPIIIVLFSRTNDKDAKRNDKVIAEATSIIVDQFTRSNNIHL